MQCQTHLVGFGFDRNEPHVPCRAAVAIAIASASFRSFYGLALAERCPELRCDEFGLQSLLQATPRPVVRTAARFHGHDRACGNLRQPRGEGIAAEVLALPNPAAGIRLARRKNLFRQINTDGYSVHGDFPSNYADGVNHHGSAKTERLAARAEVFFLLIQAETASRFGLISGVIRS